MKILSAEQIRAADRFTIENEPISSAHLMERAAEACSNWLQIHLKDRQIYYIFCGSGNNGGDGFALARLLYHKGCTVEIFRDASNSKFSEDAESNFLRLKDTPAVKINDFGDVDHFSFDYKGVVIDAIFGTGLNRPVTGIVGKVIAYLNNLPLLKVAMDIPSGLYTDAPLEMNSVVIEADYTLTFQFPKRSFFHPETGKFCGKTEILDIGLSRDFIEKVQTPYYTSDEIEMIEIYHPRNDFSHKGTYGQACIVAGSYGKIGAAVLATKAALRSGAGLTFTLAPSCGYTILQTSCPEAMFIRGGENFVTDFKIEHDAVIGIGPGLGKDPKTKDAFLQFLKKWEEALLLDADALNILAEKQEAITWIPKKSIITPHPKEFERLFGESDNSFQRLELARLKAAELDIYIVLKDHHTQIITPEKLVYYNNTGTSGMAKGGSGDALAGIITALRAQHYVSEKAALFGVWLHGKAGELAAEEYSKEALLPSDLIQHIGNVFMYLEEQKKNFL